MVLTVNGTTRSERAGGLDNGEVNRFTTRPGEYRHDLHTIEDVIENIAEKAYQRGEWVSSIELDGEDFLIAMVIEKLQENILNVSATVDALASIGFFAAADLEDLTSWVNGVKRDNFGSSDLSDLAYKTTAWVLVRAQTFEQLEAAYERKDYCTAFAGFKKLAEQGHVESQYALGQMYRDGQGVPKDGQQSVAWYRKAAEQGNVDAQNGLGYMYDHGEGVTNDDQQAVVWYRKAAEQGLAGAQHNLGFMYYNGRGVPKDDQQAAAWYCKAAEQGVADAQNNLGVMYADGQGVPKDASDSDTFHADTTDLVEVPKYSTVPAETSDRSNNTTTYPANTPRGGDASSRYVVPGLLLCAVTVALVIGISIGGEGKSPSPVYVPEPAIATNAHIPKPVEPTFANAVEQLFGIPAVAGSVKTGANEQTSFFVDVPFGSSEQVFRAVFLKTQKLESATANVESCHACAPSISAVVYQKKDGAWSVFSASKFFTDFGSWGDATINSPVEIQYDLAPRTVAFLFDSGGSGQGYSTFGKAIFALSDDGFRSLGYITLSEDNAGACDDTIELFNKCWKNFGSYAVERDPNGSFSTIRVTRTGTERGKDGNIIPVTNWIYRVTETKIYEREPS